MSKAAVARLFLAAIVAVVAGAVIGFVAVVAALAGGALTLGGPNVVTVDGGAIAGAVAWLVLASVVTAVGSIAAVAAWLGALANTYRLEDKTWFASLLVLGLFSGGWVALVAYLIKGPDATAEGPGGNAIRGRGQAAA